MAAHRQQTMEFGRSDQILKAGQLKYREPRMLTRWRNRYVEFKITAAGRLSFTVYREQPASPANEITQVCIEEYGGLDNTMKLDGEKFAFAIITTGVTECFAADSAATLQEWTHVIHEYLGKELVFAISIPYKQNTLKAGKGFIRIRNTAFTITTNETPTRCQCSWQILHIRKFGGSDAFRFETGSKCPTGEFLYVLNTEDNDRVREVFNDLSHHRPIFTDDRMGRRMTQEHAILQRIRSGDTSGKSLHSRVGTRRSLQQDTQRMYENTGRSLKVQQRPSLDDLSRPRSHAVLQDDGYNPSDKLKHSNSSTDIATDRYYYNMAETMIPGAGGTTRQLPPLPFPQSDDYSENSSQTPYDYHSYYNRTSSGAIPPLSMPPDQSKLPVSPTRATPETEESDDDFVDMQRISANMTTTTTYYNITETRKQLAAKQQSELQSYINIRPSKSKSRSPRSSSPAVPVTIPAHQEELDGSGEQPHLYTNVNVGVPRLSSKSPSASPPMESSKAVINVPSAEQSGSFYVSSRSPSPPVSRTPPSVHVSRPSLRDSPRLSQRNGHYHSLSSSNSCSDSGSDQEIGVLRNRTTSIVENMVVSADYNSRSCEDLTKIAGPILRTLQGSTNSGTLSDSEIVQSKALHSGRVKHLKSKLTQQSRADDDRHTSPKLPPKVRPTPYDHLDIKVDSRSPFSSPEPESNSRPSSRTNYDTLEPRECSVVVTSSSEDERDEQARAHSDGSDYQVFTIPQQTRHADTMNMYNRKVRATGRCHDYEEVDLPDDRPLSSDSSTASPEPSPVHIPTEDLRSWQYHRKVVVTGREHAYEQVELSQQGGNTVVDVNRRPHDLHKRQNTRSTSTRSKKVSPETLSSPTRRPLPLQHVALGYSDDSIGLSTVVEENSVEDKRPPLPRASNSADNIETHTRQKSPFRKNRSLVEMDQRQSPTHLSQRDTSSGTNPSRSPRSSTRPTRSSAPSGPPPLPPKPKSSTLPVNHQRSRSDEGASNSYAPILPPRIQHQTSFEKECQRTTPNYTRVYVSVNPVSSDGASRVLTNEKVRASPYSEINHFATRQLGIMTEARKMEKERTALPRQ